MNLNSQEFVFFTQKLSLRGAKIVYEKEDVSFLDVFKRDMIQKIKGLDIKMVPKVYIDDFIINVQISINDSVIECKAKIKDIYKNELNTYFLLFDFDEIEEKEKIKELSDFIEKNYPVKENF